MADPAVTDRLVGLPAPDTLADEQVRERLTEAGFDLFATAVCNLLAGPPTRPADLAPGYLQRWLPGDSPATVDAVRAFAERCDPDEVEAAALDELDDFDEAAINVVCPTDGRHGDHDDRPHILAYASASKWFWDPVLADIGVLVDAGHRRQGLARFVVASTVDRLLADGRIPFYRHAADNGGSRGHRSQPRLPTRRHPPVLRHPRELTTIEGCESVCSCSARWRWTMPVPATGTDRPSLLQ